ncbi:MAG: YqaA family protein [Thermoplasmatota archaeon]
MTDGNIGWREMELTEKELKDVDLKRNFIRLFLAFFAILLFMLLVQWIMGDHIEDWGAWMIDKFSYPGMFAAVLAMDTLLSPVPPDVVIFISIAGNVSPLWTLVTVSVASIMGGTCGYLIGRFLGNREFVKKRIKPHEKRAHYLLDRYGIWAVIVAALSPIPFSAVCWVAGILKMRYLHFLSGALWRVVHFLMWYLIILAGFRGV